MAIITAQSMAWHIYPKQADHRNRVTQATVIQPGSGVPRGLITTGTNVAIQTAPNTARGLFVLRFRISAARCATL